MKTVLLVDDDYIFNYINKKVVENLGIDCEILIAANGREAIQLIENLVEHGKHFPDLILLDINMPLMNGFDFLQKLEDLGMDRSQSNIVIVSSSTNPDDIAKAIHLGANHYVAKPISESMVEEFLV